MENRTNYSKRQAWELPIGNANRDCHLDKLIRENAFEEKVKRICIGPDNCRNVFIANGRFNRLCHVCKERGLYED